MAELFTSYPHFTQGLAKAQINVLGDSYSTVTLLAKLRGLSTSVPLAHAVW